MGLLLSASCASLTIFCLDGLWFGLIARSFYARQLRGIGRMDHRGLAPRWLPLLSVYALLGAGLTVFVLPQVSATQDALLWGGLFGIIVYGIYELSNASLLARWPWPVVFVDILWGATTTSLATLAAAWLR
jgi:uncharacterized membrane protein